MNSERIENIMEIDQNTAKLAINNAARDYKSTLYNYHHNANKMALRQITEDVSDKCKELLDDNNSIFRDSRYICEYDTAINTVGMDKGSVAEKLMLWILTDNLADDFKPYNSKKQEIMDLTSEKYKIKFEVKCYNINSPIEIKEYNKFLRDCENSPGYIHVFINIQEEKYSIRRTLYSHEYNAFRVYYKDFTIDFIKQLKEMSEHNHLFKHLHVNDYETMKINKPNKIRREDITTSITSQIHDAGEHIKTNVNKLMESCKEQMKTLYNSLMEEHKFKHPNEPKYSYDPNDEFNNVESFILTIFGVLVSHKQIYKEDFMFTRELLEIWYGRLISKKTMRAIATKYFEYEKEHSDSKFIKECFPFEYTNNHNHRITLYTFKTVFKDKYVNNRYNEIINKMKSKEKEETPTNKDITNDSELTEYSDDEDENMYLKAPASQVDKSDTKNITKPVDTVSDLKEVVLNKNMVEFIENDKIIGTYIRYVKKGDKYIVNENKIPIKFECPKQYLNMVKDFIKSVKNKIYNGEYTNKTNQLTEDFNKYIREHYSISTAFHLSCNDKEEDLTSKTQTKINLSYLLSLYGVHYMKTSCTKPTVDLFYYNNGDIINRQLEVIKEEHKKEQKETKNFKEFSDACIEFHIWCKENNLDKKYFRLRYRALDSKKITNDIIKAFDKRNEIFRKIFKKDDGDYSYDGYENKIEQTIKRLNNEEKEILQKRLLPFGVILEKITGKNAIPIITKLCEYCIENNIKFTDMECKLNNSSTDSTLYDYIYNHRFKSRGKVSKFSEEIRNAVSKYEEDAREKNLCYKYNTNSLPCECCFGPLGKIK